MNLEELAFLNQQLAGMLKSGIPLEGALKQLCENLRRGRMRSELVRLESELSKGVPLQKAVESGEFPEVYKTLIKIGAGTDRLPEILIHVADYYHRAAILWRRLKGLLVYPLIVFAGAIALSLLMLFMYLNVIMPMLRQIMYNGFYGRGDESGLIAVLFLVAAPLVVLLVIGLVALVSILFPDIRRKLRRRMPGYRESLLANTAATISLLMKGGCTFRDALALVRTVEPDKVIAKELETWERRHAEGHGKPADIMEGSRFFPPLFVWIVAQGADDLGEGFGRAAEVYARRADARIETILYVTLPVSILILGAILLAQFVPVMQAVGTVLKSIGM